MKYLKNATLTFNSEKCTACGRCVEVCPHAVFELSDKKVKAAHADRCMECGACQKNCAYGAVKVNAGVGCAAAVITGMLRGTEPVCGCDSTGGAGCCG